MTCTNFTDDGMHEVQNWLRHRLLLGRQGNAPDSWLFDAMPAHLYHADRDALSCSMLKPLLLSPAHFQASLLAFGKHSDAMDFGTLVHLLLLEPHAVSKELAVFPGVPSRPGEFAAFRAQHPTRLVVDEPTFAAGRRLAAKIGETLYKGRPLHRFIEESIPEATLYFTEPATQLRMRMRMDAYHPDINFDLKTTRHADPIAFARDAVDKHYDLQGFMYSFGRALFEGTPLAKPFVFIAAESSPPYSVSSYQAGDMFLENGGRKFQACAAAFKACTATDYWPDLSHEAVVELEPWQQFSTVGWRRSTLNQQG